MIYTHLGKYVGSDAVALCSASREEVVTCMYDRYGDFQYDKSDARKVGYDDIEEPIGKEGDVFIISKRRFWNEPEGPVIHIFVRDGGLAESSRV